jgi:murein DD-endopeptidase MepM/ murein hydrolase activator NlpD
MQKKAFIVMTVLAITVFTISSAFAASIPKLGWPSATKNVIFKFGKPWPFATSCTNITWKHTGIDIGAPNGSAVYTAEDGVVKVSQDSGTSWKEFITVEHTDSKGKKYTTDYWHLKNRKVSVGSKVKKGQKIAEVANMGDNTHLHFGVRNSSYDNTANRGALPTVSCGGYPAYAASFVDPLDYLK